MNKHILIVGTGLGGLSAGLRLITRGYKVSFVEKCSQAGGRLNQLKKDGFTFDVGPSFFSMPYEFEELIKDCNISMPFEFIELDPLYCVHIRGCEKSFQLYKDIDKLSAQFDGIEPDFKNKFNKYIKKCENLYNDTVEFVIKRNFDNLFDFALSLNKVNKIHAPVLFRTFWGQVNKYFESKEARQIVSLIAFFLGNTPFDTNGVYTLLSNIEFKNTGYYNVNGGMYTIVECLVDELKNRGAEFHFNTEIIDYKSNNNKALSSLIDNNNKVWNADIFIINSDAAYFRGKVFKRPKFSDENLKKKKWTMGYFTFYIGLNSKIDNIEHHNYFLGENYEDYAKMVMSDFDKKEKPYYYVNVLSKHNENCAPKGCEALFFVCPIPNLIYKNDWSDKDKIIDDIINDFSVRIGRDITPNIILRESYTPVDWQDKFNLFKGAGLGLSHNILQIGGLRPANFDEKFKNTFYVGASTVPGAGLPMAVISSKLTTERILKYQK